jgi:ribose/xylose/arabinose/galactoside ABC-type transport system permease subunit
MTQPQAGPQDRDLTEPRAKMSGRRHGMIGLMDKNRRALSALLVFVVLMLFFLIANPKVFLGKDIYKAVFADLPNWIILAVSLVFVIAAGEIDLSFVSTQLLATWIFAVAVVRGWNPFLGLVLAIAAGASVGWVNGVIVTRIGLPSLVSTLGMNFLLQGLVNGATGGNGISLVSLKGTPISNFLVGSLGILPAQVIWGLVFAIVAMLIFNYHQFGHHVCCVGDNVESAREMGINVRRVKTLAFVYVGLSAGFTGVVSDLMYGTFWPVLGDLGVLLLAILASVFVGGTPTWGGIGTVAGAVIGACIVRFIQTGIIEAGFTGFWTQFFYGLIIIIAMVGHKLNEPRHR